MKKLSFAIVGAASLALAACGGQGDDALENIDENVATENLEAMAADAVDENAALANQEEALEAEANADEATDVDANAAAVNAM